jgi:hypothetical protein
MRVRSGIAKPPLFTPMLAERFALPADVIQASLLLINFGLIGLTRWLLDALESPLSGLGQSWVFRLAPLLQLVDEVLFPAISHCDRDVAMQALASSALQGRPLEPPLERLGIHCCQPLQSGIDELLSCQHAFVGRDRRTTVPGADILADIASEDLSAHQTAQLFRDTSLLLDRQVGDAARGVHLARSYERVCRASIDTPRATSTAIRCDVPFGVERYWQRRDDDTKQQPGAKLLVDDACVFADPSYAGLRGGGPLYQRTGIDVASRLTDESLVEFLLHSAQPAKKLFVVVGGDEFIGISAFGSSAPGVAGDPAGVCRRGVDRQRPRRVVVQSADDDRLRPRHRNVHLASQEYSLLVAALEILHLACSSFGDPGGESLGIDARLASLGVRSNDGRHSGGVKTRCYGQLTQPQLKLGRPVSSLQSSLPRNRGVCLG